MRDDYENFHLRVEAKINDKGNSGQYFRAKFGPGLPSGYEAQINSTAKNPTTGSLYGFVSIKDMLVPPDTWFIQEVIANGSHIQILVNGKKVVDFIDKKNTYARGHFALQHQAAGAGGSVETRLAVRKIEVKELPKNSAGERAAWTQFTFNNQEKADWRRIWNFPLSATTTWDFTDTTIVGTGGSKKWGLTYLENREFENFELKYQLKIKDGSGIAGVEFRGHVDPLKSNLRFVGGKIALGMNSCELLMGIDKKDPVTMRYQRVEHTVDAGLVAKAMRANDFNDIYLACNRNRCTFVVNGTTVLDQEISDLAPRGKIAFSFSFGEEVSIRNALIRDLTRP